jgi:monoamine oxidase
MLEQMERLFPGVQTQCEVGASHCWDSDPWAQGAWAEGIHRRPFDGATWPEGRIYLAGDHLSSNVAWMQGAFESGQAAARAVNDA